MIRARGRTAIAGSLPLLVVALARMAWGQPPASTLVQRDVVEVAPSRGVRIQLVDVDNRLGDVRIEGQDRESISILAVKRAPDEETMERLKVSLVPDPAGPIAITTVLKAGHEARPIPAGAVRIDLVVLAPRQARVRAQVWKGKVAVQGVDNGAELVTNEGDIQVSQVSGAVTTQSGQGRHSFAQVFGAVDARAVKGDMDLDLVRGDRLAAVVNAGDVIGTRIRVRDLSIRILRGNVRLEGEALLGGRYTVASYWGNVEVKFSGKAPLRVRALSRSGEVSLPSRVRRRKVAGGFVTGYVAGSGGRLPADIELRTRVGMVTVTVAEF